MKKFCCVIALIGCAAAQRPYHFTLPAAKADTLDAVVRAFAADGQSAGAVNREAGTVQTGWQDTGFGYGFVGGGSIGATVFRRYTAIVNGADVTLRADVQKCAAGSFDASTGNGRMCEAMDGLVPPHQEALDALGQKLQASLSH